MALVKCPECGRENVSDSANACPFCGYDIKTYFERKKRAEVEQKRKKEDEYRKKAKMQEFVKTIQEPQKPKVTWFEIGRTCICFIIAMVGFIIALIDPYEVVTGAFLVTGFGLLGCKSFIDASGSFEKRKKEYELAKKDFEAYKAEMLKKEIERQEREELDRRLKQYELDKLPCCPVCKSHNTKKITVTSRAVSVAAVGVASSKIGKQYECKDCKHKW